MAGFPSTFTKIWPSVTSRLTRASDTTYKVTFPHPAPAPPAQGPHPGGAASTRNGSGDSGSRTGCKGKEYREAVLHGCYLHLHKALFTSPALLCALCGWRNYSRGACALCSGLCKQGEAISIVSVSAAPICFTSLSSISTPQDEDPDVHGVGDSHGAT